MKSISKFSLTASMVLAMSFTLSCSSDSSSAPLCGETPFNIEEQFCLGNAITPLCGGQTFASSQFCHTDNEVYDKCGGTVTFAPGTEACCGNGKYTLSTHFCSGSTVYSKCGNEEYDPSTHSCDARDSKLYKYVTIGDQIWMAENLNFAASGSKCGDGSSLSDNNTTSCDTYGRLYNWETAMDNAPSSTAVPSGVQGVCPSGWHLPSQAEWNTLSDYVQSDSDCSDCDAKLLKAESGWNSSGNGTDEYGFSALPGGNGPNGPPVGGFYGAGNYGHWWSASENDSGGAYRRHMAYNRNDAYWSSLDNSSLFSVRCVRD